MIVKTPRITLRDFNQGDRAAFVAYQMDPRYRRLYEFSDDQARADKLFDLFLTWQSEIPRHNFQIGIFDSATKRLCGCAGLRVRPDDQKAAVIGIELAPSDWGRYRIALDAAACLIEYGFDTLQLRIVVGDTASGNKRVEKIARWFGARMTDEREGPEWMRAKGWREVDWALTADEWRHSDRRSSLMR